MERWEREIGGGEGEIEGGGERRALWSGEREGGLPGYDASSLGSRGLKAPCAAQGRGCSWREGWKPDGEEFKVIGVKHGKRCEGADLREEMRLTYRWLSHTRSQMQPTRMKLCDNGGIDAQSESLARWHRIALPSGGKWALGTPGQPTTRSDQLSVQAEGPGRIGNEQVFKYNSTK